MKSANTKHTLRTIPLLILGFLALASSSVAGVVYSTGFETAPGVEWSKANRDTTPAGARTFLGQFGKEAVTLALLNLPPHTYVEIEFDLFIIRSWDGNGTYCCGPDIWDLSVVGGPTLLHTTFAYNDGYVRQPAERQAFPDSYPGGNYIARTGAVETNSLGFTYLATEGLFPADTVYHLKFSIPHGDATIVFSFSGSGAGFQEIANESWGLDNLVVRTIADTVPSIRVSQVEVCWDTRINQTYQLQYRSDLTTNLWTDLGTPIQGDGFAHCIDDTVLPGQPRRFYRVVVSP